MTRPRAIVGEAFGGVDVLGVIPPGAPDPTPEQLAAARAAGVGGSDDYSGEPYATVRVLESLVLRRADGVGPPRRMTRSGFAP